MAGLPQRCLQQPTGSPKNAAHHPQLLRAWVPRCLEQAFKACRSSNHALFTPLYMPLQRIVHAQLSQRNDHVLDIDLPPMIALLICPTEVRQKAGPQLDNFMSSQTKLCTQQNQRPRQTTCACISQRKSRSGHSIIKAPVTIVRSTDFLGGTEKP